MCYVSIIRQLPEDANRFSQVDHKWKEIMKRTEDNPNALKATTAVGVLEMLQSCNAQLEKIQKSLEVKLNNSNCSVVLAEKITLLS